MVILSPSLVALAAVGLTVQSQVRVKVTCTGLIRTIFTFYRLNPSFYLINANHHLQVGATAPVHAPQSLKLRA